MPSPTIPILSPLSFSVSFQTFPSSTGDAVFSLRPTRLLLSSHNLKLPPLNLLQKTRNKWPLRFGEAIENRFCIVELFEVEHGETSHIHVSALCPRNSFILQCDITDEATLAEIGDDYEFVTNYLSFDNSVEPTALVVAPSLARQVQDSGVNEKEEHTEWIQGTFFLWKGAAFIIQKW
jgi:hypothetical protein